LGPSHLFSQQEEDGQGPKSVGMISPVDKFMGNKIDFSYTVLYSRLTIKISGKKKRRKITFYQCDNFIA